MAPNQGHKDIHVVVVANMFVTMEMERSFGVDLLSLELQAYYQQKGRRPSLMERQTKSHKARVRKVATAAVKVPESNSRDAIWPLMMSSAPDFSEFVVLYFFPEYF